MSIDVPKVSPTPVSNPAATASPAAAPAAAATTQNATPEPSPGRCGAISSAPSPTRRTTPTEFLRSFMLNRAPSDIPMPYDVEPASLAPMTGGSAQARNRAFGKFANTPGLGPDAQFVAAIHVLVEELVANAPATAQDLSFAKALASGSVVGAPASGAGFLAACAQLGRGAAPIFDSLGDIDGSRWHISEALGDQAAAVGMTLSGAVLGRGGSADNKEFLAGYVAHHIGAQWSLAKGIGDQHPLQQAFDAVVRAVQQD